MRYVLVLMVLGVLILIHEFGHLLAARRAGIPIERFSVGFGPRLLGIKKGGIDYCLSVIPLGGYVLPRVESEEAWSDFSLAQRTLFCLGGPAANLLAALAVLFALNAAPQGYALPATLFASFATMGAMVHQMAAAIIALFRHPDMVSGIVGIVAFGGTHACGDTVAFLNFAALLNVNLALFNLLPVPPLDGGRILLSLLETIYKPLQRAYLPVTLTGWLLMLVLMLYATALDIGHLLAKV